MLARALGATLYGVEGVLVRVEAEAGRGLPLFQIVGQPDGVVREGRDRVRAAFRAAGLEFPEGRVTVNLAPTSLPKTGSGLDLPIAAALAVTRRVIPGERIERTLLVGELGLDGSVRSVRGVLPAVSAALDDGVSAAIVPRENLAEATALEGIRAMGVRDFGELLAALRGDAELTAPGPHGVAPGSGPGTPGRDLSEVRGQSAAKRALELAAAGGHNLLLVGPPGGGKTLLAQCLPGILPDLGPEEAIEVSRIHSVAGTLAGIGLVRRPPFRAPHHSASVAGLLGGSRPLRPGELSLAHRGVLFLDELPEFRRGALEGLREPLEEGEVRLVRAGAAMRLPARFQLVAAMNPCPCGNRGEPTRECVCDDGSVRRYGARISGPLLDRIDLHVAVPPVPWKALAGSAGPREESSRARSRVAAAWDRQRRRSGTLNAHLPARVLWDGAGLGSDTLPVLERAVSRFGLSVRALVRVLRLARTIADLAGSDRVEPPHVSEAVAYRIPEPSAR